MTHSKELERHLLSALIKAPHFYGDIAHLIDEEDFFTDNQSYVNQTIFKLIKNSQNSGKGEVLDHIILIDRLRGTQISFEDNIDGNRALPGQLKWMPAQMAKRAS